MTDIFTRGISEKQGRLVDSMPSEQVRMFSSFCINPIGVSFVQQEPDEKIILFLRRHFATNAPWIAITSILVVIPVFLLIFRIGFQMSDIFNIPIRYIVVFAIFYYLIVFSYAFVNFITWFYNVLLVTEKRIVDIDYSDIVIHNIAFTKLNLVQDVNYTQAGFIRSFFNYGDVFIQTAGTAETHFEGLSVPQPRRAAQIIVDLLGRRHHAV